jgi:hypothetical protein
MAARPSAEQYARYPRDGCLFPVDCLTPDEVRHYLGGLEPFEHEQRHAFCRHEHGNFDPEPPTDCEFEPASRAVDTTAVKRTFDTNSPLAAPWRSGDVGI